MYREGRIPDFVLQHPLLTEKEAAALPGACFADPGSRQFPTHTAADAWLSLAYFNIDPTETPSKRPIRNLLEKAAEFWRMSEADVAKTLPVVQKEADTAAVVELRVPNQPPQRIAVHDAAELQKVAADLYQRRPDFPYRVRRDLSRQLLQLSAAVDMPLEPDTKIQLQKMAGFGTTDPGTVLNLIRMRQLALRPKLRDFCTGLEKVAEGIKQNIYLGVVKPEYLNKVASVLDAADRAAQQQHRYSGTYRFPEDDLFVITADIAGSCVRAMKQVAANS
jgi:hypothetical protein